ncbi:unnamed protein product [Prorocentrum cordatum]|uniref:Uncharacterized protein n=1 Tax=Prorocentrum cordatum TaxID=2364126 RepID=A0ABN9VHY5_9DINO|nr:unnamed protein product [Polarella glacialis]
MASIAGIQQSLASTSNQFAKGWTTVAEKLETTYESISAKQAEQEARIDLFESQIKELHGLLGNIKRAKPLPPAASDFNFDRDVDQCILILRSKLSCTRASVRAAIGGWLQRAQIAEGDVDWEGDETGNKHVMRIRGARMYAARKDQQAIENQAQVKRELGLKYIRRELELHYPSLKYYSDKLIGEVSTQWKPLVRVEPLPGDVLPRFEFALENLRAFSIDKETILSGVKANYRQQSDAQWSV